MWTSQVVFGRKGVFVGVYWSGGTGVRSGEVIRWLVLVHFGEVFVQCEGVCTTRLAYNSVILLVSTDG